MLTIINLAEKIDCSKITAGLISGEADIDEIKNLKTRQSSPLAGNQERGGSQIIVLNGSLFD